MADAGSVQVRFEADVARFTANINLADKAIENNTRLVEQASARAEAAWNRELNAQDRRIAKESEVQRTKELAALKADILSRSQAAEAEATERADAALSKFSSSLAMYAGGATGAASATDKLSSSMNGVASSGGHLTNSTRAISGAFQELEGRTPIRALERFLATSQTLAPVLEGAFPIVGAVALGGALLELGGKAYRAYEDIVNLRGALEGLNEVQITVDAKVNKLGDETEAQVEDIVEKTKGKAAALRQKASYQDAKPVDLSDYFYNDKFKKLPDNVKAGYEDLYKNVAPADVPARLAKIRSEVTQLQGALASTSNAFATVKTVNGYGPSEYETPSAYYQARLTAAQQIQERLAAEGAFRSTRSQAEQINIGSAQTEEQQKAQQKAEEAARKAAEAVRKASEDRYRAMELARQQDMESGRLGAQADLEYWTSRIDAFSKGSTQYLQIARRISEDEASLARSAEAYRAEQARGAEGKAKNAEQLDLANVQLDLASGKIDKVTADQRTGAAQAALYTAEIAALRQELTELNRDLTLTPEDRRTRSLGLQNRIADLQGEQQAQGIQNRARQIDAAAQASHGYREEADALEALSSAQQKSAASMAQLLIARDAQTGAISKNEEAFRLAQLHEQEFQAQIAALYQRRDNANSDTKLTSDQKQVALLKIDAQITDVSGEADRTAMQDKWNEFTTTALGGAIDALAKFDAAAQDSATQLGKLTADTVKGFNDLLLKDLTSKNYTHADWHRDFRNFGAGEFRQVAGMGLQKGEAALFQPLTEHFMGDGSASSKALAAFGLGADAKPSGSASNPLYVKLVDGLLGGKEGGASDALNAIHSQMVQSRAAQSAVAPIFNSVPDLAGDKAQNERALFAAAFPSLYPGGSNTDALAAAEALGVGSASSGAGAADALAASAALYPASPDQTPQFSTIQPDNSGSQEIGATVGKRVAAILPFIPGFADGTPPLSEDTLAWVGERGPELRYLSKGTGIIPNHKVGDALGSGGLTHNGDIHIHAQDVNDPESVQQASYTAYRAALRDSQAATAHRQAEQTRRTPGLARR